MSKLSRVAIVMGMVICGACAAPSPAAAATGSIGGTVTDAGSGDGVENIWVCAYQAFPGLGTECATTDADGKYTIAGLQPSVYKVAFAEETSLNYLAQWYHGKATRAEAEGVAVGDGETVTGKDAALEVGGQVTGTVTDVETLAPVEGVWACAIKAEGFQEEGVIPCDKSDAAGEYTIHSVPSGSYKVEFFVSKHPNYIRQLYPGKASAAEATPISVTAGAAPVAGIDAAMQRGISITGTVTEAGGSGLTWEARVCAVDPVTEVPAQCDFPEKDGTYAIAGLPFGLYAVSFAVDVEEEPGLILRPDGFVRQYYNGKPTLAEADRIGGPGPAELTGIDAHLVRGPEVFPNRKPAPLPPTLVTLIDRPPTPPVRCKKGFRKKFVRGKRRCVKVHKRHRHHKHRHGPRAHATDR